MRRAEEKDYKNIIQYLQAGLQDCIYLYIDVMNYGIDTSYMKIWIEEYENGIEMVVMKYYDSFQIYSHKNHIATQEFVTLLEKYPVAMVSGKKSIIEQLSQQCQGYEVTYGTVFEIDKFRNVEGEAVVELATVADTLEIASLICSDKEIGGHYTPRVLAAQLAERIETHTGRSYIIREGKKIVAHSATYAEAEGIAVVGGTIIAEEYRTGSYYMLLSNYMLQQMAKEKKQVYTFSVSPKMIRYHGMLHTKCGEYGKLVKYNVR